MFSSFAYPELSSVLVESLRLDQAALDDGAYWKFASYALLHFSWIHIALNLIGLFFFGPIFESWHGRKNFLVVLIGGILVGGLLHSLLDSETAAVGASGGILAILACLAAHSILSRDGSR
ncbi:rhomboid family intramembrane serine protease [Gammaproteobacteria bacterium AB-CW1]|uniref:Rhomboid family intramembrane serine protease n=2 Tax=Natronospira TaxID=2024969 RepID=A0AAP6JE92_9GAMM|nr:rhomboid family intramembrane serine protease [Gammaproteobacteria bacterium AB-CW1]